MRRDDCINRPQMQDIQIKTKMHPQARKEKHFVLSCILCQSRSIEGRCFWTADSGRHLDVNYSSWPYTVALFPVRKREREEGVVGDQWTSQKLHSNTFM